MSEFKAQILGILIVIAAFGAIVTVYKNVAEDSVNSVSVKMSEVINSDY